MKELRDGDDSLDGFGAWTLKFLIFFDTLYTSTNALLAYV